MSLQLRFLVAIALGICFVPTEKSFGGIVVNIFEQSGDVKLEASGTINTSALTFLSGNIGIPNRIAAFEGEVNFGVGSVNRDIYQLIGTTIPAFGSSFYEHPDISTGDAFGIRGTANEIFTPVGYTSGDAISAEMIFTSETLSSLGLTIGTYEASWGTGLTADTFTINVLTSIPEPSGVILFGLGAGFALVRRQRRSAN